MNIILILFLAAAAALFNFTFAGGIKGKIIIGNEALNNVVVYLEPGNKINFTPPDQPTVMDQINMNFVPHILPVLKGTEVIFPNSDKIRHSVFSSGKVKKFDFGTYPPGKEKSITCNEPGIISILCYIHHDMSAYIVVLETPYFSLTNNEGDYSINNVAPGNYKLSFWHEDIEITSENISIPEQKQVTKNIIIDE